VQEKTKAVLKRAQKEIKRQANKERKKDRSMESGG